MKVTVYEAADTIGGGTRTSELTLPGLLHDHCSAVHPMGVASPVFQDLDLASHGLEWLWPQVDMAHPFDDGSAGVLHQSLTRTAAGLEADESVWTRLFGRPTAAFDQLRKDYPLRRELAGSPVRVVNERQVPLVESMGALVAE